MSEELQAELHDHVARMDLESERGCVLIGAAAIDDTLGKLLRAKLAADSTLSKRDIEFLLGDGQMPPLRPFALRIIFCHAFGIIQPEHRRALESIKAVRNHFSHFSGPVIIDISALKPAIELLPDDARQKIAAFRDLPKTDENAFHRKKIYALCVTSLHAYLHGFLAGLLDSQPPKP